MLYYRHNKFEGLFTATTLENGRIEVAFAGGAVLNDYAPEEFSSRFTALAGAPGVRRGTVTAEFLGGHTLPCLGDGVCDGGFGRPLFDLDGARILASLIPEWVQVASEGRRVLAASGDGTLSECERVPVVIDGASTEVFRIGDGWGWDPLALDGGPAQ